MKTRTIIVLIIVLGIVLAVLLKYVRSPLPPGSQASSSTPVATAHYLCDQGKTIDAEFYEGSSTPVAAGQPPVPGGSAHIVLSDGREMTLKQTISADGVRYSNGDPRIMQGEPGAESFVFWSKGNGALVLEHNVEKSYINCVAQ